MAKLKGDSGTDCGGGEAGSSEAKDPPVDKKSTATPVGAAEAKPTSLPICSVNAEEPVDKTPEELSHTTCSTA